MTPQRPAPAIGAMWVWDNPVDPADDPRGRGYAPAAADRLAAFAQAGGLREVHVAAPSGTTGGASGPVDDWLRGTVDALHGVGAGASAVAGVAGATTAWVEAAVGVAPFDRLQVAVLPWAPPGEGGTAPDVGSTLVDALAAVRAAAGGLPVDACVPWWFATRTGADGRPLLDPVLDRADRVVLAAPAPHAEGPDGVLGLAAPAVEAITAAGRPFLVGVQTDTPDAAGGDRYTFFDEGPVALVRECGVVAAALAGVPGFEGVTVASHRAWRRLLGV